VGPNGLLNQLTATVLEAALEAEMDEHLGYEKYQAEGRDGGNSRNGRRAKVLTEIGPVTIEVPRGTESTFEPQIVKKRQRRLTGIDEIVLSLSAKGLTTGEIAVLRGRVRSYGVVGPDQPDHRLGALSVSPSAWVAPWCEVCASALTGSVE
jgi:transposase-like protein